MTKEETAILLKLISSIWGNFEWDDDIVTGWQFVLNHTGSEDATSALRSFAQNSNSAFAPSPAQLIKIINDRNTPLELRLSPEEAWLFRGGHPVAKEAFKLWGGEQRWRTLPDPRYSGNPNDQRTIDFAIKEFHEIYRNLVVKKKQELIDGWATSERSERLVDQAMTKAHDNLGMEESKKCLASKTLTG